MSMFDLYEKENPFAASKEDTTAQASTKTDVKDSCKPSEEGATPVCEKGNLDSTLISDEPATSRKLGLEDLNEAIESIENMDMDNSGKETGGDDSVESDPKEADLQEDVGPDVDTSLGQQDKPAVEVDVWLMKKTPILKLIPWRMLILVIL